MRKTVLLFLAVTLIGGWLVWLMISDPGYLLIAVGQYTLEMSLWAAILLLVAVWLLLRLVRRIYLSIHQGGVKVLSQDWFDRKGKSRRLMGKGLVEFMEGRWAPARKNLLASAEHSEMPLLNLLAAATAAYEMDDIAEVDRLLERAANASADDLAVDLVRARLLLRRKSYVVALQVLEKLHRRHPSNTWILSMLVEGYKGLSDWPRIEALLPDLKRLKALPKPEIIELQRQASIEQLKVLSAPPTGTVSQESAELQQSRYRDYWNQLPTMVRKQPEVLKVHLQSLYRLGLGNEAEKMLRKLLKKNWDQELVRLYGVLEGEDPAVQLVTAEGWLSEHGESYPLLLTLARLSQRNELWGKARDYLEKALSLSPTPEIYLDLAQLNARLGDHPKSAEYYKRGLLAVETSQ